MNTRSMAMIFGAVMTAATQAWAGYEMTASVKYERPGKDGVKQETMLATYQIDKDKGRFEFTEGTIPVMSKGAYLITKDGGKTMTLVDPSAGAYSAWSLDQMLGMAGGALKFMNAQVTNPKADTIADEAGPMILGHPTRHYKFVFSYGMEMAFMGMKQSTQIEQEIEMWTSPKLAEVAFNPWARQQNPKTGIEQIDMLTERLMQQVKGFPLKQTTVNKTADASGRTSVSRTTMEITGIKNTGIPAERFEVPAGYVNKDLTPGTQDGQVDIEKIMKKALQEAGKTK